MKWTQKRKKRRTRPQVGDERVVTQFLVFPKTLDVGHCYSEEKETRWLCAAKIVQKRQKGFVYKTQNLFGARFEEFIRDWWADDHWLGDKGENLRLNRIGGEGLGWTI